MHHFASPGGRDRMKRLRAATGLLFALTVLAAAPAPAAAAHVTRCYADCPAELTGCRDVLIRGRFYRDGGRRIVYAGHAAGCCGAVMLSPPTDRRRDCVSSPPARPAGQPH